MIDQIVERLNGEVEMLGIQFGTSPSLFVFQLVSHCPESKRGLYLYQRRHGQDSSC